MSWVQAAGIGTIKPRCVMKYSRLEDWQPVRIYQTVVGSNNWAATEKNWVYFESDENLFCIYASYPEQIVLHTQGNIVINEHVTKQPRWPYGNVRGGAIVPYEDKFLRIFHSSPDNELGPVKRRYVVGALLMQAKPPFEVLAISKKPIIYGSEVDMLKPADRKGIHHHKPNVVFPCGVVLHDNRIVVSIGVNDSACALVKLKFEDLNL